MSLRRAAIFAATAALLTQARRPGDADQCGSDEINGRPKHDLSMLGRRLARRRLWLSWRRVSRWRMGYRGGYGYRGLAIAASATASSRARRRRHRKPRLLRRHHGGGYPSYSYVAAPYGYGGGVRVWRRVWVLRKLLLRPFGGYAAARYYGHRQSGDFTSGHFTTAPVALTGVVSFFTACRFNPPRRRYLKWLDQRLRRERLCEIGEASGLKCGLANGRFVVSSHVDDRHTYVGCFETVSEVDT